MSVGKLVTMLVAMGASVAVAMFALPRALAARNKAQAAAVASAQAAQALERTAEAAGAEGRAGEARGGEPERPSMPQGGFLDGADQTFDASRHETLTPRQASAGADGERVAPFHGFGVQVDSDPAGARVFVDEAEIGETPLLASVRCDEGATVRVRVEKAGRAAWTKTTRCRKDALVALEAKLALASR
jgi:hypothetical protein